MPKVILIVDDNKALLEIFSEVLSRRGYTTLRAENGREGVRLAQDAQPHLILMDIHMPVMNGFDALSVLQSDSATKSIPSIAMTSSFMPKGRDGFLKLGFADHIEKPIDIEELEQVVDGCLGATHEVVPEGVKIYERGTINERLGMRPA